MTCCCAKITPREIVTTTSTTTITIINSNNNSSSSSRNDNNNYSNNSNTNHSSSSSGGGDDHALRHHHFKPWTSLLEPASWGFAIWGLIYVMELLLTLYVAAVGMPVMLLARILPCWLAGHWMQALWCFLFRPEYKYLLQLPTASLLLAAIAFAGAYNGVAEYIAATCGTGTSTHSDLVMVGLLYVMRSTLAIHTSWLVIATFVNGNSWVAISTAQCFSVSRTRHTCQAAAALISVFVAAGAGLWASCLTRDPCFAATAAWALDALASRAMEKGQEQQQLQRLGGQQVKGEVVADVHESLAVVQGAASVVLKCTATMALILPIASYAMNAINLPAQQ